MEYFKKIKEYESEKLAFVEDETSYTYYDICKEVEKIRKAYKKTVLNFKEIVFIKEKSLIKQMCFFLALSGTNKIPVIIPPEMTRYEIDKIKKSYSIIEKDVNNNICMGVLTSGTTGIPKLFYRTYESWALFFDEQNRVFNISNNSVVFFFFYLSFTGNLNIALDILCSGGTIVTTKLFDPRKWEELIINNDVNSIYLIPIKIRILIECARYNEKMVSIITGSQSMGKDDVNKLKKKFPNSQVTLYYGGSELSYISYIKDDDMTNDDSVVGKAFSGIKILISNEKIYVDTPFKVEGISCPYTLFDIGYMDRFNMLHLIGRKGSIQSVNGYKVDVAKIEKTILAIDGIKEVKVSIKNKNKIEYINADIVSCVKYKKVDLIKILKRGLNNKEIPSVINYKEN